MLPPDIISVFRADLRAWYRRQRRDLPWRRDTDPYRVWISEVMLQQTRVSAVIPYYERFLRRFPNVASLAEAPEPDLLANWAGLGYYYRVRNLQRAAQVIAEMGEFPSDYETIRSLPGIGDYTAAAVGSISFDLPYPVVDGNVYRVASRLFSDETDISSSEAKKHFTGIMQTLLDREHPGEFNQAVMELGATVCLPKKPQCLLCPIRSYCAAGNAGDADRFPVKTKGVRGLEEVRQLFWIEREGEVLLWQRPPQSRLMPGFWELPEAEQLDGAQLERQLGSFRHSITTHNYRFEVWRASLADGSRYSACQWVHRQDLDSIPLSTVARKALPFLNQHRVAKTG